MNFGDILDEWNRRSPNAVYVKEEEEPKTEEKADEYRRLRNKKPDAVVDLHGLTQDEAWTALDDFFRRCRSLGHEKVLVIHGKGNHSGANAVLKEVSRKYIELCPFAGASGRSSASSGGSGATWVLLKS